MAVYCRLSIYHKKCIFSGETGLREIIHILILEIIKDVSSY